MQDIRIDVAGLGKSYGQVNALTEVDLWVGPAMVLGVLGHNGAGKTTLIDILATRVQPTAGYARVCGWDVVRFGHHVRRHIGMTGQFVGLDDAASGRANLILFARLLGASGRQAKARADELIEMFDLTEAAGRKVATYSGGMRRRLDLAVSLLGSPDVLFLDEPSTGLDPVSRLGLWQIVHRLAATGTTVVLTTQYLAEADQLADDVVVLAGGKIVAAGSPSQLKASLGTRTATVRLADPHAAQYAVQALAGSGLQPMLDQYRGTIMVPLADAGDVTAIVRVLDTIEVHMSDLSVAEPTLEDVYVALYQSGWGAAW